MVDLENFTMPANGHMTSNFEEEVVVAIIMVSTSKLKLVILFMPL